MDLFIHLSTLIPSVPRLIELPISVEAVTHSCPLAELQGEEGVRFQVAFL